LSVSVDNRHGRLRVDQRALRRQVRRVLADAGRGDAWVDVSLVADAEIAALNRDWRGVDGVTDVLSFALDEVAGPTAGPEVLGDVVISLDTAARQARRVREVHGLDRSAWRLREETLFLLTHGVLHLLGHDHATPEEAAAMAAEERRLLGELTAVPFQQIDRSDHAVDG
jgi:probable rRNA maturation factor